MVELYVDSCSMLSVRLFVLLLCLFVFPQQSRKYYFSTVDKKFREISRDLRRAWTGSVSQDAQTEGSVLLCKAHCMVYSTVCSAEWWKKRGSDMFDFSASTQKKIVSPYVHASQWRPIPPQRTFDSAASQAVMKSVVFR